MSMSGESTHPDIKPPPMTNAPTRPVMKLLNPGPVTLTARVRRAFDAVDVCHREQEFADLVLRVKQKLSAIYPESAAAHIPVLLTGSGTAAVEAMLSSLTFRGGKTLIVANGVYGERAAAMLEVQGKEFQLLKGAWEKGIDLRNAEQYLAGGGYTHVFTVHHETTTGRLNDVAGLGALCKKFEVPMLLDAVSSFAGEDIRFAEWNLEACAATANKCIHGVPGIAFVLAHKSVFGRKTGASSVYLDLFRYEKEQRSGFSPFTQATHAMYALEEAIDELRDAGGWEGRRAHYRRLTGQVVVACAKLDTPLLLGDVGWYSSMLTSYKLPPQVSYETLHDALKNDGFVIYAGQGNFAGAIFRIAVMGDLTASDMERLAEGLGRVLGNRG